MRPGGGSDLSFEFSSSDIKALRAISDELKEALDGYEGVTDINDTFSGGSEEIQLALKPQAGARNFVTGLRATGAIWLLWC